MQNKVLNEVAIDQMDDLIKAVKGGSSGFDTDGTLPELGDGAVTDPLMAVGNDGKAKKIGVKTLFGKHNIRGSGNIDLYKHTVNLFVKYTDSEGEYSYALKCVFYSSNSLNCDSLTDLKTILGNTFEVPIYGVYIKSVGNVNTKMIGISMTQNGVNVFVGTNTLSSTYVSIANVTFTDTVTTI